MGKPDAGKSAHQVQFVGTETEQDAAAVTVAQAAENSPLIAARKVVQSLFDATRSEDALGVHSQDLMILSRVPSARSSSSPLLKRSAFADSDLLNMT